MQCCEDLNRKAVEIHQEAVFRAIFSPLPPQFAPWKYLSQVLDEYPCFELLLSVLLIENIQILKVHTMEIFSLPHGKSNSSKRPHWVIMQSYQRI